MSDAMTRDKMLDAIKEIPKVGPDPLCGATRLVCARDMLASAREIQATLATPVFCARSVTVVESPLMPPGYMVGFKGTEAVLIVGPDKDLVEPSHAFSIKDCTAT